MRTVSRNGPRGVAAFLLALAACAGPGPTEGVADPRVVVVDRHVGPPPSSVTPASPEPPPGGEASAPQAPDASTECNASLFTRVQRIGRFFEVAAIVRNERPAPLELALPDRCPAGPVDFDGLGAGYDYYGTCVVGACAGPRAPSRVSLDPGEERIVASIRIDVAGDACQRPLTERAATIGFSLAGAGGLVACASERAELPVSEARQAPRRVVEPMRPARTAPRRDCPAIACGGCPNGYAPSTDGCPSCACLDGPGLGRDPPPGNARGPLSR